MAVRAIRLKRVIWAVTAAAMVAFVAACGSGGSGDTASNGNVTLEFAQWWGAELPAGDFDKIVNDFTAQNPNIKIKLLSAPYASTKQQLITGAASRTLPTWWASTVPGSTTSPSRAPSPTCPSS